MSLLDDLAKAFVKELPPDLCGHVPQTLTENEARLLAKAAIKVHAQWLRLRPYPLEVGYDGLLKASSETALAACKSLADKLDEEARG